MYFKPLDRKESGPNMYELQLRTHHRREVENEVAADLRKSEEKKKCDNDQNIAEYNYITKITRNHTKSRGCGA